MGFSKQEYWSGLPCPSPGDLPDPGIELLSFASFTLGSGFFTIAIPKKGNAKECSNYCTIALISHTGKVMLKILQARLQQYMNRELPDVQAGNPKQFFLTAEHMLFNPEVSVVSNTTLIAGNCGGPEGDQALALLLPKQIPL